MQAHHLCENSLGGYAFGLHIHSFVLAPNAATFDFVPFVGDPQECRGYVAIPPLVGPREGRGEGATFDFITSSGGPRECNGYVAIPPTYGPPRMQGLQSNSAHLWAPEKAGVRQPLLIFTPRLVLDTPENTRVT